MSSPHRLTAEIHRSVPIVRTPRVLQLEGMFDVPPAARSERSWRVTLPLDDRPWSVGLIVGPSGCGKTTIARELFADAVVHDLSWPEDRAVVDGFPAAMSVRDVTKLLSSVGFSSPPSWLRPFRVLSTGEQFRASVARALAEKPDLCVVDEFTSVVDRTVARIGSCAIAKTVRRRGGQFIAVTCHHDVEEWLDPDWVYAPDHDAFRWRSLQGRPKIELHIARVHHSAWRLFAHHHYLTADLHRGAICFCAFIGDRPVAFHSYMAFIGRLRSGSPPAKRGHRSVTLPDFQGVGIGDALITHGARMWKGLGYRIFRNTGHPAEIAAAARSKEWKMIRPPSQTTIDKNHSRDKRLAHIGDSRAAQRLTASFEFVGAALPREAATHMLNAWAET